MTEKTMKEILKMLAASPELAQQAKETKDAQAFGKLMAEHGLDAAAVASCYDQVQKIVTTNEVPDEFLDQVSGGEGCGSWSDFKH